MPTAQNFDAVVIGGGFYGVSIALYLMQRRGFRSVAIVEKESGLLTRASLNNQARVHNGYHYPRSFTTAFRSRVNLPKFLDVYGFAVSKDLIKLYAIARNNSKVTSKQFNRFCRDIGAMVEPAPPQIRALFEPRLIEDVFLTEEFAFDARKLARAAFEELAEQGVTVLLDTDAHAIRRAGNQIMVECEGDEKFEISAQYLFNCSYSGLNQLGGDFLGTTTKLKHEITEMALIEVPPVLKNLGITVMDGPFFSVMPYPSRGLHTLSHVRYTPHTQWPDSPNDDPYKRLVEHGRDTRVSRMIRDSSRYVPALRDAVYRDSLFETKTILVKNEGDDGRPILFEKHLELPNCYSILGGKIDNIFDALEKLDSEPLVLTDHALNSVNL